MTEKGCLNVFLSSTFVDLIQYRKKALDILNKYKCTPLAMEFFDSRTQDATTVCEKEIQACHIFIGIYAHRYGYVPEGQEKSITQMEYELAKKLGKDILCFTVNADFEWKPKFIENEKQTELKEFLGNISANHVIASFTTPEDLGEKLATSLANYMAGRKKGEKPEPAIPGAPLPYIAHPYPMPQNFTGRLSEMAVLSNWFHNDTEPVLVMEAIGGMGKSALSWTWLQKEILAKNVEASGVFWWSFYDGPFDTFIWHLSRYVMGGKGKDIDVIQLAAALQYHKFLLVLDGLERALIGYAGMEAMFIQEKRFAGDKEAEAEWDRRMREPVHPLAARFLRELSVSRTRVLITTRLMPAPLERLAGVKHMPLTGLSPGDAVSFLVSEGVKGSRAELEDAGRVYGFHPLMLTLLAAAVTRSRTKDINAAFLTNLIDRKEPHKILSASFNLLSREEREVVSHLSVFRSVFTFEASAALVPGIDENRLWDVMSELRGLGFLFYDETADHFDFHPIMRSFLYRELTASGGAEVHHRAVEYFQALPEPEKVVTLEDLAPVIELYHHLVKAGKFDEACDLFYDRLAYPTYYQLSAYHLIIELLCQLFPEGDNGGPLPRLKKEADQAWTLTALANTYSLSGQPAKAVPLFLSQNKLQEKNENKQNLAVGLGNVAQDQWLIGQFSASSAHLRKSITLCREIENEFWEAVGHQELGRVLAFRGKGGGAQEELAQSTAYKEKTNDYQGLSIDYAYRSLSALLQARLAPVLPGKENRRGKQSREALEQAIRALAFAEEDAKTVSPLQRDFVQAYWLLGEALVQCAVSRETVNPFEIPFYDDHFQEQTQTAAASTGNEWTAAERCLHEALRRCRKTNMVYHEPDILLALARLDRAKHLPPNRKTMEDAQTIAQRAGYRLQLADYHLLCGQWLLQDPNAQKNLPGRLTASQHLEKAQEYALDVSELSHLYQSPDPDFYKGIPEYQVLKRGMTKQERIENGYSLAYKCAGELLKRV